ncbi:MAG: biotin/lipoyl-binding protein, partial [Candidatus Pacebacteria bacterium]|nr:biotin/lipoyl-binding protein [Candidatus Paceibacterota bacterium]
MKTENKINKKYVLVGLVILLVALYFVFRGGSTTAGLYTVATQDVAQNVVLSGTVKTSDKADLGFASSGRISKIFVRNNQAVTAGQTLAQLEVDDLLADLKIKQANYKTSDLDLESAVENKYRTLLSDGLTLVPDSNAYTM